MIIRVTVILTASSRSVIWIAQFKWRVWRCFPSDVSLKSSSQIAVWMPWPLNCDLESGATWLYNHFHLTAHFSNRNSITNEIPISMSEEHRNEPHFFSPLWNAKSWTRRSLLFFFLSALVWKQSLRGSFEGFHTIIRTKNVVCNCISCWSSYLCW